MTALIAEWDPKQNGVPILLKQYLKLGGKLLGFNRDPKFNNVLDVLILVRFAGNTAKDAAAVYGGEGLARFNKYYSNKIPVAAGAIARPVKCGGNGFGELTKS